MSRRFLLLSLLLGLTANTQAADDLTVVGALDFAFKDMTLEAAGGGGGSGQSFNTTVSSINPGLAIAYKRFYANVNYDKSINSETTTQIDQGQPSALTMSRSDTVLTLGYRAADFASLYVGWLSGEIGAYLTGQYRFSPTEFAFYTQDISYTEKGPFAGVSFSHNFGEKGSASLSVAYAKLDGEFTQIRYTGTTNLGNPPITQYDVGTADVNGLSYNLTWTGALTGSLNYRLGVKYTRYEGTANGPGSSSINEYYTAFFLGLTNVF